MSLLRIVARSLALAVAVFALVSVITAFRRPAFDPSIWLLDLRWLPRSWRLIVLIALGSTLGVWGAGWERAARAAMLSAGIAALFATLDAINVFRLIGAGFSTSAVLALAFVILALGTRCSRQSRRWPDHVATWSVGGILALTFPGLLIATFGHTDYRREADAIVVFGARAYADGRPSRALRERMETGCELYQLGLAPKLILSGGPGDGDWHETEVMRRMALECGIPGSSIVVDTEGLDTRATARRLRCLAPELRRVLAVSHDFHLPRIELAFAFEGLESDTVPLGAPGLPGRRRYLVRECAAFWFYLIRG